jgi:histidinol-phosphate aminotransferase
MVSPRPKLKNVKDFLHGGIDYKELVNFNLKPEEIIDFSSSLNPLGTPYKVLESLVKVKIDAYPDTNCYELKEAIAKFHGLKQENIIVGNGSTEIIYFTCQCYLTKKSRVIIPSPTFSEYERASVINGAKVVLYRLKESNDFRIDPKELLKLLIKHKPKMVFLCNPNNPTGHYLGENDVREIIEASEKTLIVLDEAYVDFVKDPWDSTKFVRYKNLLILKSLTKNFGLAGLRIGYALADEEIIKTLEKVRPPWNVNSVAQKAALVSLFERKHIEKAKEEIELARSYLIKEISKMGRKPIPSHGCFFMVKVDDARKLRLALLEQGILVRDCTSFGLPNFIRISVRRLSECKRLIKAWREVEKKIWVQKP